MEIAFEALELRHTHPIRRTAVDGNPITAGQLANLPHAVARITMLAFHHADRVLDAAKRTDAAPAVDARHGQLAHVRKKDLLLLDHVLLEFPGDGVEGPRHSKQFWMPLAVCFDQLLQIMANHRKRE